MLFPLNGGTSSLRKKNPSRKCSRCSPRGRISGSSEPEYPAPGPNIRPKYPPPSMKLHAHVLSEIFREGGGGDNPALGQIIRPHLGAVDPCSTWSLAVSLGTRIIRSNTEISGLKIWVSFEPLLFFLFSFVVDAPCTK
jgi:hypothetical protein